MNPLKMLEACGQSPWLDYLQRSLVSNGELQRLIQQDGLKGVTSNPSIFERAIGGSDEYAGAIHDFAARGTPATAAIYEHLAIDDIRAAADLLAPVYEATVARDGYVSLECSPLLANDTQATIAEGLRLWADVGRANLMVKVPATPAGIPAIRALTGHGLNVNVTLLFSVATYELVADAYLSGLEDRVHSGGGIANVASVASFFVSRIDREVDKKLTLLADRQLASQLHGKLAIANARIAYARYRQLFSGPRWQALESRGARSQRLLWASTGVKDAAFKDTMYVEALIGRDTVNTLPPSTMDAFRQHGLVTHDAVEAGLDEAYATLARLEASGISLPDITAALVKDGVAQFVEAFDKLFAAIERQRTGMATGIAQPG